MKRLTLFLITFCLIATSVVWAQNVGDYRSAVDGGKWNTASTWEKFDGTNWVVASAAPGKDNNVTIRNGYDVILDASGKNCKNLYIETGATFVADKPNPTSDQRYVRINGDSAVVNGTFGDPNSPGNNICLENARSGGKIVITGTGTFAPSRFRVNSSVSGDTTIFDIDTKFMYTGSSGTGGVAIYPQTDNNVIIFNAGKTITFVDYASICVGSSISSASGQSVKFIVNGTMDLSQPHSSFTLLSAAEDTATLIVGETGSIVIGDRFLTTGATEGVSRVTIDGSITVNGTATFANENSFVDGTGSFILGDGATLNIGVPAGLDPVAGPIRTTTRTLSTAANYVYNGTVAQVTGSDLPATVNDLVINNIAGVTLSESTVCDTLRLTNGDLALNGKALTWGGVTGNGTISETQVLATPSAVNVGNLGAVITSSADLGSTVVKRGFAADSVNNALSISRWYIITPTTNTGLNATLVFNYDESELNGLSEEHLSLYNSADTGKTWDERGGIQDVGNNKITLTGIDAFSMWTAGATSNIAPLPFAMQKPADSYTVTNNDLVRDSLEVKWSKAVDPEGDAITYKLFIYYVDQSVLVISIESADTSILIEAPTYRDNGNYQAYVLAYDKLGAFSSSDTVNFILKMNTPPSPFTVLKPTEGYIVTNSDIVRDSLEVKWSKAVDPDGEALTYNLFILKADIDSVVISIETPDTSILIEAPSYKDNGNYKVYVLAYDLWEAFSSSDTVNFTINLTQEGIKGDLIPKVFALHQNYPNPFNPITTIKYDLPEEVHVKLVIYDIMGREIRTLVNERQQAGYKSVIWDARNNHGMQVSSGYYICVMQAGEFRKNHKMVLMK